MFPCKLFTLLGKALLGWRALHLGTAQIAIGPPPALNRALYIYIPPGSSSQRYADEESSSPRAHCKCNDPGIVFFFVFLSVFISAMIQDHSLVASRHFLIETENTTTHYPKDGKDYDGGVLDGFTSIPKEQ